MRYKQSQKLLTTHQRQSIRNIALFNFNGGLCNHHNACNCELRFIYEIFDQALFHHIYLPFDKSNHFVLYVLNKDYYTGCPPQKNGMLDSRYSDIGKYGNFNVIRYNTVFWNDTKIIGWVVLILWSFLITLSFSIFSSFPWHFRHG